MITPPLSKLTDAITIADLQTRNETLQALLDFYAERRLRDQELVQQLCADKMFLLDLFALPEPSRWWRYGLCVVAGAAIAITCIELYTRFF